MGWRVEERGCAYVPHTELFGCRHNSSSCRDGQMLFSVLPRSLFNGVNPSEVILKRFTRDLLNYSWKLMFANNIYKKLNVTKLWFVCSNWFLVKYMWNCDNGVTQCYNWRLAPHSLKILLWKDRKLASNFQVTGLRVTGSKKTFPPLKTLTKSKY